MMVEFLLALFFVRICGYSFNDFFSSRKQLSLNFWILTGFATILLEVLTGNISGYINQLVPRAVLRTFLWPDIVRTWTEYLFRIVVSGALGGFYQEFIFRGFLQTFFSKRLGGVRGFILTAFLFAVWHLNPLGFIRTFMFGLFCGYLVYLTGNLWLVILMHSLVNSLILSLKFFGPKIAPISSFVFNPTITVVCAILLVASLDRLRKTYLQL
jgi:membrane protease YdiL (CAAX protease family)